MDPIFSPGEIGRIAQISPVKQRDLRRRGIIQARTTESHTRYSLEDLGFFMALNSLSEQNVPISGAAEMAGAVAVKIAQLAAEYWTIYIKHSEIGAAPPTPSFHCFYRDSENGLQDFEATDLTKALMDHSAQQDVLISALIVLDTRYLAGLILERAHKPLVGE